MSGGVGLLVRSPDPVFRSLNLQLQALNHVATAGPSAVSAELCAAIAEPATVIAGPYAATAEPAVVSTEPCRDR